MPGLVYEADDFEYFPDLKWTPRAAYDDTDDITGEVEHVPAQAETDRPLLKVGLGTKTKHVKQSLLIYPLIQAFQEYYAANEERVNALTLRLEALESK